MDMYEGLPATVTVPDFIGLDFDQSRQLELHAQVKLADPDPDAPPIRGKWFRRRQLVVATQAPPPGTKVYCNASVTVTLSTPDASVGARVRQVPPPALNAHAVPETTREQRLD